MRWCNYVLLVFLKLFQNIELPIRRKELVKFVMLIQPLSAGCFVCHFKQTKSYYIVFERQRIKWSNILSEYQLRLPLLWSTEFAFWWLKFFSSLSTIELPIHLLHHQFSVPFLYAVSFTQNTLTMNIFRMCGRKGKRLCWKKKSDIAMMSSLAKQRICCCSENRNR